MLVIGLYQLIFCLLIGFTSLNKEVVIIIIIIKSDHLVCYALSIER